MSSPTSGAPAAVLRTPNSGRELRVFSTMPGLQLYAANMLDGHLIGKGGAAYPACSGVCLEAQNRPNAVSFPHFPSPVLRAGERYEQEAVYAYGRVKETV